MDPVSLAIAGVAGIYTVLVLVTRERRQLVPQFRLFRAILESGAYQVANERSGVGQILLADSPLQSELVGLGFRPLGDMIFSVPNFPIRVAMRGFVDETGTISAYLTLAAQRGATPTVELESSTQEQSYGTSRTKPTNFSMPRPPFFHRIEVDPAISIADLLALHRKHVPPDAALISIATGDEQLQEVTRHRALDRGWRASLDPAELLEIDIRGLLGKRYARYAPLLKRRLAAMESARRRPAPEAR
ncbi:MAG: hypothetical protein ABI175_06705 [Polyangiales bacterium]